jgi:hypothetical protein
MKTPHDKYLNDPEYHNLVKTLEAFIEQARFTPSELREACILAAIHYERRHAREYPIDSSFAADLEALKEFANRQ